MTTSKLMNMTDAISRWVVDGSSVAIGTTLETAIPFAAGHEIMRQGKKNLTLIGPISDILFDQLIGAGCVQRVRAAWVGNVITGVGYNFRRAVERRQIEVEDHSNLTISLALQAGAMGVSFLPTRTALGSDLFATNTALKSITCPFTGQIHAAVAAIVPDVAIVHVQRSDAFGNAHPSPMPGYYNRDHKVFIEYQTQSRTPELFSLWMNQWIGAISSIHHYVETLGDGHLTSLSITHHDYSEPVDYGY